MQVKRPQRQTARIGCMSFLLDTHVISEWTKPRPNSAVIAWLDKTDEDRVFPSVATLAEFAPRR